MLETGSGASGLMACPLAAGSSAASSPVTLAAGALFEV